MIPNFVPHPQEFVKLHIFGIADLGNKTCLDTEPIKHISIGPTAR